jgi:hypothetical protein
MKNPLNCKGAIEDFRLSVVLCAGYYFLLVQEFPCRSVLVTLLIVEPLLPNGPS